MKNVKQTERILIFEPHPDDVAFFISGSVARWISEGREVMICTVTRGNRSTFDANVSKREMARIMLSEHKKAMRVLGLDAQHYVQWKYDDLGLDPGRHRVKLLADMIKLIRTFKPVTVVTMDPKNWPNEENPDHRLAAMTGFEAAAMSAYPNVFRKQFAEKTVRQHFVSRVLFYTTPEPDTFIDIGGEPFERKVRMALAYPSQLQLMEDEARRRLAGIGQDFPLSNLPVEQIWSRVCRAMAEKAASEYTKQYPGRKRMRLAEAFRMKYPGVVDKLQGVFPKSFSFR